MKKVILYSLLLVGLIIATFFVIRSNNNSGTIREKDKAFALENIDDVHKIFIANLNNEKITLEKKGNGKWYVNGKYPAREAEVNTLLETMKNLKVKAPVPLSAQNNVIKSMATKNTIVEAYNKEGKVIKSYMVGPPSASEKGTFMRLTNSKYLFEVGIPGFDGHLSSRYFIEEKDWRSREIFAYEPYDIQSVSIDYLNQPMHSFELNVLSRDSFSVEPLQSIAQVNNEIDKKAINVFLNNFKMIHAEAFVNDLPFKKDILSQKPIIIMSVTDKRGDVNSINIYSKPVSKRSKNQFDIESGEELEYDQERFYALINDGKDFVVIQDFVFGKLFAKYDFFVKQGVTAGI